MIITFIRHGESEANLRRKLHGATDFNEVLTMTWQEQARALGEKLSISDFDAVYSSDMPRAKQTAEIIFRDKEIIHDVRIREYFAGDDWEHEYGEWPREEFADLRIRWFHTWETYDEQITRVRDFLSDCAGMDFERVAVVAHMWVFRVLWYISWKVSLRESLTIPGPVNTSIESYILSLDAAWNLQLHPDEWATENFNNITRELW